jgi:glycosyltransferase involved in cell wall biosynthesis
MGLAAEVQKFASAQEDRVRVLRNPFDFSRIEKLASEPGETPDSNHSPVIVFAGRLTPQKRPDLLLRALARLRGEPRAQLWICGEGPKEATLRAQVRQLGLGERVRMLGFQDNPYRFLRKADLFVLCSDFEGLPNALVEAQGLGLPAVATRCPFGPDEIIEDKVTGLLVPVGNVEALATAIDEILSAPERGRTMGRAAAERTRRQFDSARVTRTWERIISEGASGRCAE